MVPGTFWEQPAASQFRLVLLTTFVCIAVVGSARGKVEADMDCILGDVNVVGSQPRVKIYQS